MFKRNEEMVLNEIDRNVDPPLTPLKQLISLNGPRVVSCANCRLHLTHYDDLLSKSFVGSTGRAYLFNQAVNLTLGPEVTRNLLTGVHVVSDVSCKRCSQYLGWKYIEAHNQSEKYKVGKVILEKRLFLEEWHLR